MLKETHMVAKYIFRRSFKEKKLYWGKKKLKHHSFQLLIQKTQHPRRGFSHWCLSIAPYLTTNNSFPLLWVMGIPSNVRHQTLQTSAFQLRFSRKLEVMDLTQEEFSELQLWRVFLFLFFVFLFLMSEWSLKMKL